MRNAVTGTPEKQPWLVYALLGITVVASTLVIWGNVPRISAWLLVLLVLGIGQGLLLPTTVGALGGLVVAASWVVLRQWAGIWQPTEVVQSLLELACLSASVALAILFRRTWARDRKRLDSLQPLQTLVGDHTSVSGLVSRQVAELRLAVEMDRAVSFGHPLGVILLDVTPRPGLERPEADLKEARGAVARQLSNVVKSYDTPFSDGPNRMGVIMPERGPSELRTQTTAIASALADTVFLDSQGSPQPVSQMVRLDFGLTTCRGEEAPTGDLLRTAEECLSISRAQPNDSGWCCMDVDGVPVPHPGASKPVGGP